MARHKVTIITDLGFGDAGKGSITDALARKYRAELVVRYNGGAQAAHTVQTSDGKKHTFHQFGSGTLVEGTRTFLSRYMLINPLTLVHEEQALAAIGVADAFSRLFIHAQALVTTPYHMIANRLRELMRGANRHGSCGLGIGETMLDSLEFPDGAMRASDLRSETLLRQKMRSVRERKRAEFADIYYEFLPPLERHQVSMLLEQLESDTEEDAAVEVFGYVGEQVRIVGSDFLPKQLQRSGHTIFEGAQGVLLDEVFGFHPNTTWSTTTTANADALLTAVEFPGKVTRLGLIRAYQTRHGAGPFPTENERLAARIRDENNPMNHWQGAFRMGWLDLPLTRYALAATGPLDGLVVSCLDHVPEMEEPRIATEYLLNGTPYTLTPNPKIDLRTSERIGRDLRSVRPVYAAAPSEPMAYAQWIAESLALPLSIVSFGPTAEDKEFVDSRR